MVTQNQSFLSNACCERFEIKVFLHHRSTSQLSMTLTRLSLLTYHLPICSSHRSSSFNNILKRCLQKSPDQRPNMTLLKSVNTLWLIRIPPWCLSIRTPPPRVVVSYYLTIERSLVNCTKCTKSVSRKLVRSRMLSTLGYFGIRDRVGLVRGMNVCSLCWRPGLDSLRCINYPKTFPRLKIRRGSSS